jgi:hypothetical protein
VAIDRSIPLASPLWSRRMVEWGILVVLVLVLLGAFERQLRVVQGQAELAAVQSTLGALRTAFVLEHLQQAVAAHAPSVAVPQRNPFLLLKSLPANYAGQFGMRNAYAAASGSWVFDPDCVCIGYLPLYPQWLQSPPDTSTMWWRASAPPGPMFLTPLHPYVWQGQSLN